MAAHQPHARLAVHLDAIYPRITQVAVHGLVQVLRLLDDSHPCRGKRERVGSGGGGWYHWFYGSRGAG